ncbi:MAG: hypothetical protein VYA60_07720 [Pseudomonadota bacterium]|nr:hypothetical protein [Pseudomonadota bacterium]
MNTVFNPYSIAQESISLRLKNIIDTKVSFRYQFYTKDIKCANEPMYPWLVNTRRLLGGIEEDPDRQHIKHQRRATSWIGKQSRYWLTSTRYFVIGYAIEDCKVSGMKGLALDISALIELFTDKDAYAALIQRFTNDFFFQSSLDIHSKDLCRKKRAIEHQTLKTCFINGYRLCSDLYLALTQTSKMGPIHSYMELKKACEAVGFDELPLWFIQESHEHGLNAHLEADIEAQKHYALWALVNKDGRNLLVSENDPYGVEGTVMQSHVMAKPVSTMLSAAPIKRVKKKKVADTKSGVASVAKAVTTETQDKVEIPSPAGDLDLGREFGGLKPRKAFIPTEEKDEDIEIEDNSDLGREFAGLKPRKAFIPTEEEDEDIEIEEPVSRPNNAALALLNQYRT